MAVNLGKGTIGIGLDDQTKSGLNKIEKNAGKVSSNIEDKFKKLGGVIAAAFAGTAVFGSGFSVAVGALIEGGLYGISESTILAASSFKYVVMFCVDCAGDVVETFDRVVRFNFGNAAAKTKETKEIITRVHKTTTLIFTLLTMFFDILFNEAESRWPVQHLRVTKSAATACAKR